MYGAEVWQIPTREINKILSTEIDVLRRSARKSRVERIKNEHHHHDVQEGLGLIPVLCILKMKMGPPSLPRSSCVSSSFWFIL